ncbi:MAG: hypothetical protein KGI50_06845 [Patescibacteria group bacterium]|nr:hypothetical protein [Patescibacteria group bacterium]MDE2439340.1 hypothetical protein [Patescibacteria group bacterium]
MLMQKVIAPGLKLTWTLGLEDYMLHTDVENSHGAIDLRDIEVPTVRDTFINWSHKQAKEHKLTIGECYDVTLFLGGHWIVIENCKYTQYGEFIGDGKIIYEENIGDWRPTKSKVSPDGKFI